MCFRPAAHSREPWYVARHLASAALLVIAASCSGGGSGSGSAGSEAGGRVAGIVFDWSTYLELAPGSDNWPLTWCEDDHQYTSWGDGGGFGGTNLDGRVSLGFARIEGRYETFQVQNLWGGQDPVVDADFNGKVTSMLCLDGVLYAWHSPGASEAAFDWQQLIVSEDKGITWEEDAIPQSRVDG